MWHSKKYMAIYYDSYIYIELAKKFLWFLSKNERKQLSFNKKNFKKRHIFSFSPWTLLNNVLHFASLSAIFQATS